MLIVQIAAGIGQSQTVIPPGPFVHPPVLSTTAEVPVVPFPPTNESRPVITLAPALVFPSGSRTSGIGA